nr:FAD:protein FMN transferase [Parachlamydiaceae bacterium]
MHANQFFVLLKDKHLPSSFFWLLFLLLSCSNINDQRVEIHPDNTTHFTGEAMTMSYHIIVGRSLNKNEISKINDLLRTTFQEIDSTFNKWNPNSELSRLNQLKANIKAPLSPALEIFLKQTQLIVELSEGRFDPTIEPLQQLWKAKLNKGKEPTEREIAAIAPTIGWDKIHFGNGIFFKDHD